MARRPRALVVNPDELEDDPFNQAVREDRHNVADQLADALESLGSVDQSTVRGILYKIPVPNGKYEWIRDVFPPFDLSEIMRSLKEEVGGGDYAIRLMAEGKVRKTVHFSIMRDKTDNSQLMGRRDGTSEMLPLMVQLMSQSSDRQMQMMMTMSQQAQASQAQQTQMMVAMITAMMGNAGKPTDLIPLIAAMQSQDKGGGMKEAIETLVAAKGLFSEGAGGLDADDLVGSVVKLAGPVAGAIGRAVQARQDQAQPAQLEQLAPGGQLMLPGVDPGRPVGLNGNPAPPMRGLASHPVLDLVRDDVTFAFNRRYDPELTAELVLDRLEEAGVTEADIGGLVAQITLEPDPWAALAAYGCDLRSNLGWGEQFISALVRLHADAGGEDADSFGGAGDAGDLAPDEAAGPGRVAVHDHPEPGG